MKKGKVTAFIIFLCAIVFLGCGKGESGAGKKEAEKAEKTVAEAVKTEEAVRAEGAAKAEEVVKAEETAKAEVSGEGKAEALDGPVYNDDGTITLPEGFVGHGLYDVETEKIIEGGTKIEIVDDTFHGSIHFQQNFPIEKSYLLIVMIDYRQHEFDVDGQSFCSYPFQLTGESEISLDVTVPLSESEGSEISFLIVPNPEIKPYMINGEYDWDNMFDDRRPYILRYSLERNFQIKEEQEFPANFESFQAEVGTTGFELVKPREELKVCVEGKGGERLDLAVMNQAEEAEETTYVIIGFVDWEQVPVDGEHLKYYVTVKPGTSVYIPVILPEVTEPSVFQIIAFSEPDTILDKYNWDNPTAFRVYVKP